MSLRRGFRIAQVGEVFNSDDKRGGFARRRGDAEGPARAPIAEWFFASRSRAAFGVTCVRRRRAGSLRASAPPREPTCGRIEGSYALVSHEDHEGTKGPRSYLAPQVVAAVHAPRNYPRYLAPEVARPPPDGRPSHARPAHAS